MRFATLSLTKRRFQFTFGAVNIASYLPPLSFHHPRTRLTLSILNLIEVFKNASFDRIPLVLVKLIGPQVCTNCAYSWLDPTPKDILRHSYDQELKLTPSCLTVTEPSS